MHEIKRRKYEKNNNRYAKCKVKNCCRKGNGRNANG
jgi:hypothetical protein